MRSYVGRIYAPLRSPLALIGLCISLSGVVMIFSASQAVTAKTGLPDSFFGVRQLLNISVALIAFVVVSHLPLQLIFRLRWLAFLVVLFLLIVVLLPFIGLRINGSRSWLDLGIMRLQPVELAKPVLIVCVAGLLYNQIPLSKNISAVAPVIVTTLCFVVPVLLQPDFGGLLILGLICGGMLFIAGFAWRWMILIGTIVALAMSLSVYISHYRWQRLITVFDPWADPTGSGYQMINAIIAISRGGWFGNGLGKSVQKYLYLPEAHTDFLLAITIEELGLVALYALLFGYVLLLVLIAKIARKVRKQASNFGYLCCWGVFWMLGIQTTIAIGVNLAILPTTGLTLPFFSYGGSSLLATFISIGLVVACMKTTDTRKVHA